MASALGYHDADLSIVINTFGLDFFEPCSHLEPAPIVFEFRGYSVPLGSTEVGEVSCIPSPSTNFSIYELRNIMLEAISDQSFKPCSSRLRRFPVSCHEGILPSPALSRCHALSSASTLTIECGFTVFIKNLASTTTYRVPSEIINPYLGTS